MELQTSSSNFVQVMELHTSCSWNCIQAAHGTTYKLLMELHTSCSWNCMQAYETACKLKQLHFMQADVTACNLIELNASSWNCMQAHGTAGNLNLG